MANMQRRMSASAKPTGAGGHGGGPAMMRGGEKPKDLKGTIKKLAQYIGKYKLGVAFVLVLSAAASLFSLIGPKLLGLGTDVLYQGVEQSFTVGKIVIDYDKLWGIITLMAALYIVSFLFSLTQGFMMAKISNKVTYNLRNDVSLKINRLPLHYFDTTSKGDVLSRITNDVDTINQSLNESMTRLAAAITLIIGTIYMMLSISVVLTLISFLVIPASLFLINKIVKFSQPLFKRQQKSLGQLNGHIEEMLSAHLVVKSFNMEQQSLEEFEEYNNELCSSAWKSQFASHMMMPLTNMVSNIGYVLVCIVGATLVNAGRLSVGSILSFIQYVRNFNQPIQQIANISTMLQSAVACSERVFEFLDEREEAVDADIVESTENIQGSVEFKNVTFGYDEDCTVI
ncbi:MAG: ABC transporter ATP-binding protein, partial [Oscillospiraceae bacterium]